MNTALDRILDGNTFVVCDSRGDIEASATDPTGLFSFDTRYLSTWVLTVDGQRLNPLSTDDLQYFESRFFLVPGTGTVYIDAKLSVIRQRAVGGGFHEELTLLNHLPEPVDVTVRIDADSDFNGNNHGFWRARYSGFNPIYYNPKVRYQPWSGLNRNNVEFPNINPAQAVYNNNPGPDVWDPGFRQAVVRMLASEFAIALFGQPDTSKLMLQSGAQIEQIAEGRLN